MKRIVLLLLRKMNNLVQSLSADPLTLKKAVLLCCYAEGFRFVAIIMFSLLKLDFGLVPDIIYLVTVLIIAREMGRDELRRIFGWRDIPLAVFAGVLVMFYGFNIVRSELRNMLSDSASRAGWFFLTTGFTSRIILFLSFFHTLCFRVFPRKYFLEALLPLGFTGHIRSARLSY